MGDEAETAVQPKRGDSPKEGVAPILRPWWPNPTGYRVRVPTPRPFDPSGPALRVAVLAPIAWRTPPRHYGPWELFASLLAEGLVAAGHDVTLFATADSVTGAELRATAARGWSEDDRIDPKVAECLHIANVFEHAAEFDVIHNGFDFLPLTYSGLVDTPVVTTIHGFSSTDIVPVYQRYDDTTTYVAISDADRHPRLHYAATIHHGIDTRRLRAAPRPRTTDLVFFGRIHPDKGTAEAIEVARRSRRRLVIAGIIQDQDYFDERVAPHIDGERVRYVGPVDAGDRSAVLGQAHALLHLIDFDEPFGYSVVEAWPAGRRWWPSTVARCASSSMTAGPVTWSPGSTRPRPRWSRWARSIVARFAPRRSIASTGPP